MRSTAVLLLVLLLTSCAPYRVTHNLAYGPEARQVYDFYEPRLDVRGSPRPALLVVHGGGYTTGDKAWADSVAKKFCLRGYVVVAINYTLADGTAEHAWPRQLADATKALAYVRGVSTQMRIRGPIVGLGVSAGAHLVSALHLQGDLKRAIGAAGPWDLANVPAPHLDDSVRALLGLPAGASIPQEGRVLLSPATWVTEGDAVDMLLIHARRDPVIPYENATRFEETIQMAGGKVKLVTIDSSSHGSVWSDAIPEILTWLR